MCTPEGPPPPPTWFHIEWYRDYNQYPNGLNDMIGYWAENYIIGGVLLFDRRDPGSSPPNNLAGNTDPDGVYIHPDRDRMTYRICKLLDTQKKEYLDFLHADTAATCPLPLKTDENNLERVDPEEHILQTGIYRDSWERLPFADDKPDLRLRDVITQFEYPRHADWWDSYQRAVRRRNRIEQENDGECSWR